MLTVVESRSSLINRGAWSLIEPMSTEDEVLTEVEPMKCPHHTTRVEIAVEGVGSIYQVARDAIAIRAERGVRFVYLIFNDLPITVHDWSTIESVCAAYEQARKDHHYGEHCERRSR
jgi:hypothetical protein